MCKANHTGSVNNDLKNLWQWQRLSGRLIVEGEIFMLLPPASCKEMISYVWRNAHELDSPSLLPACTCGLLPYALAGSLRFGYHAAYKGRDNSSCGDWQHACAYSHHCARAANANLLSASGHCPRSSHCTAGTGKSCHHRISCRRFQYQYLPTL